VVLTVREEAQKQDIQEIHTTEAVLPQVQVTLVAVQLQEDTQGAAPASPVAHLQEEATAEVHQEAIDDKTSRHEKDSIDYTYNSHGYIHRFRSECI
jgi:hypothetical protein